MGTVDGRGYDGQLKYTICDACRLCHSNLSILKPIFHQNQHIHRAYNSLRCLDVEIRWFLYPRRRQRQRRQNRSLHPCACMQGKKEKLSPGPIHTVHVYPISSKNPAHLNSAITQLLKLPKFIVESHNYVPLLCMLALGKTGEGAYSWDGDIYMRQPLPTDEHHVGARSLHFLCLFDGQNSREATKLVIIWHK